jgi:hypothetical protein
LSEEPIGSDALLSEPASAEPAEPAGWAAPAASAPDEPPPASSPEPMISDSSPPPAASWGPSVSDPPPASSPPAWTPPETSAPAPAPAWEQPAATPAPAATPSWSAPAPAPAPAAPAPQPQPMPPTPNPSPGDPFALGAAAQRLDQAAQAASRTALVATAAVMVQGERVEAVTAGRLDGAAAVFTLTDRRLLAVNQRDWSPVVTWFNLEPQLDVQAWEDHTGATIVLSAAGRQVTLDTITDKQPAYELVARLRARLGR